MEDHLERLFIRIHDHVPRETIHSTLKFLMGLNSHDCNLELTYLRIESSNDLDLETVIFLGFSWKFYQQESFRL